MLSLHNLVNRNKCLGYIFALAYTIITNYYMGLILCVASVVFVSYFYFKDYDFKTKIITNNKTTNKFFQTLKTFLFSSIISVLLSSFVILPSYFILKNTSVLGESINGMFSINFSPLTFISQLFPLNTISIRSQSVNALPNIYCGTVVLLLVPSFFLIKSITKREKIITAIMLIFFYFSFSLTALNFIWHGLHLPNDLPYRFSFTFSFFIVMISYKTMLNIKEIKIKSFVVLFLFTLPLYLFISLFSSQNKTQATIIVLTVLLTTYFFILLKQINKTKVFKVLPAIFSIILILEMSLPYFTSFNTHEASLYNSFKQDIEISKSVYNNDNTSFDRLETLKHNNIMDSAINHYNSVSTFSSMNYQSVSLLQKYLGTCSNGLNTVTYYSQTPVYNLMFGINYLLDNRKDKIPSITSPYNETVKNTNGEKDAPMLYKTNFQTGFGFSSVNKLSEWEYATYNPFVNQNNFLKTVTGISNVLDDVNNFSIKSNGINCIYNEDDNPNHEISYSLINGVKKDETKEIIITTTAEKSGNYYAFVLSNEFDVEYIKNNNKYKIYQSCINSYLYAVDLGELYSGESFEAHLYPTTKTKNTGKFNFFICRVNDEKLNDAYTTIKNNGILEVEENNDTYIKTKINTKTGFIYTTLPYDSNWSVYIDGNLADNKDISVVGGALFGIKTSEGEHTIEFEYKQKGLVSGILISSITLCSFVLYEIFSRKRKSRKI